MNINIEYEDPPVGAHSTLMAPTPVSIRNYPGFTYDEEFLSAMTGILMGLIAYVVSKIIICYGKQA